MTEPSSGVEQALTLLLESKMQVRPSNAITDGPLKWSCYNINEILLVDIGTVLSKIIIHTVRISFEKTFNYSQKGIF